VSRTEDWALLMGRLFIAALFLPSGFAKLMNFSAFAASLRGVPIDPTFAAAVLVGAEVLGPVALIVGLWPRFTAVLMILLAGVTVWMTQRSLGLEVVFSPRQHVELYERLAIMGGLLLYFASGPGGWSRTSLR
jgi:putative oxidoreductase